jgi:hypothetical protein
MLLALNAGHGMGASSKIYDSGLEVQWLYHLVLLVSWDVFSDVLRDLISAGVDAWYLKHLTLQVLLQGG